MSWVQLFSKEWTTKLLLSSFTALSIFKEKMKTFFAEWFRTNCAIVKENFFLLLIFFGGARRKFSLIQPVPRLKYTLTALVQLVDP
jgi:hypothetical protein